MTRPMDTRLKELEDVQRIGNHTPGKCWRYIPGNDQCFTCAKKLTHARKACYKPHELDQAARTRRRRERKRKWAKETEVRALELETKRRC